MMPSGTVVHLLVSERVAILLQEMQSESHTLMETLLVSQSIVKACSAEIGLHSPQTIGREAMTPPPEHELRAPNCTHSCASVCGTKATSNTMQARAGPDSRIALRKWRKLEGFSSFHFKNCGGTISIDRLPRLLVFLQLFLWGSFQHRVI